MLTFSKHTLTRGLGVKCSSVVLRDAQQRPHEVRELLCTQTASALLVKQLKDHNQLEHVSTRDANSKIDYWKQ